MTTSTASHDLEGRTCAITGASTGIGRVTAEALARRGATVLFLGRGPEKTAAAIEAIRASTGNDRLEFVPCDLGSLASVRDAALRVLDRGAPLDWLVNNAGVAGLRGRTADGFELAFGTNHLAHFLLTEHLWPLLAGRAGARVINVASRAHHNAKGIDFAALRAPTASVSGLPEYAVSKLANVLHAVDLARRGGGQGVAAFSLHPGVVGTDIWERRLGRLAGLVLGAFMLTPEQGARTTLHCALAPGLEAESGAYFVDCAVKRPGRAAREPDLAERLRTFSLEAVEAFLPINR